MARNTAFLTVASVGQKIIAFVYFLFLARVMMPELTGQYFLAISITVIFTVVADMGITPVIIREVAKQPNRARELLSHAIALKIPLFIIAMSAAILITVALGYDTTLQKLVALATLVLALDATHLLLYGVLRGFQQLRYESLGVFAGQLTIGIIGGAVLWQHPSLTLLVVALLSGSVMNVLVSGTKIIRLLGAGSLIPRWQRSDAIWIARSAIPFALSSIFVKVYSYLDSIIISKFLDTASVGIYSIAYKFTYAFQFLPLAFVAALYPGMSAVVGKDQDELSRIFLRAMWYMAILSTPIVLGIWAVAPEVVLLAGSDYALAAPVLATLVFVLVPIFLDFPVGSLLNASGLQGVKTAIMGITMVINAVLNWFLIPRFGIMGAAYAALVCFSFMIVAGLLFVPRIIPSFRFARLLMTILPIFACGVVMVGVVMCLKSFIEWYFIVPVGAAVYVVSLFISGSVRKTDFFGFFYSLTRKI